MANVPGDSLFFDKNEIILTPKILNRRVLALEFRKKVLILGYGAVAKCTLPILLQHVKIPYDQITILDFEDKGAALAPWTAKGIRYFRRRITPENLGMVLSEYLSPGGLLIDLAWNIDCCEMVQWCHDHDVLYVNTSVEVWDPDAERFSASPYEKIPYNRQMKLQELTKDWNDATTFVVDHGANPGLISHFAKQGLIDIARRMIADGMAEDPENLERLIREGNFAGLAMEVGVKVIHCSERDTQISCQPKKVDEFVGTWCIEGLREEGTAPAEIGWGTHEKELPDLAMVPAGRAEEPDPARQDGDQYLGEVLDSGQRDCGDGHPARGGIRDLRPLDRLEGREGHLPARPCTTPTCPAMQPSRPCMSCGAGITNCSRSCGS